MSIETRHRWMFEGRPRASGEPTTEGIWVDQRVDQADQGTRTAAGSCR